MGLEGIVAANGHRYQGLRAFGFGASVEMNWPEHPKFPNYGYTITRFNLDGLVAENAAKNGADVLNGVEAVDLIEPTPGRDGQLLGAAGVVVKDKETDATGEIRGRYLVVADGQNSRLGRELGVVRNRDWPMGMALRGYYTSDRHDEPWIDSHLDIRDTNGEVVPGIRMDLSPRRRTAQRRRRAALDRRRLEGRQHDKAPGVLRRPSRRRMGTQRRDVLWPARPAGGCRWGSRSDRASARTRSRSVTRPARSILQRRGHRLRLRVGSTRRGRRSAKPSSTTTLAAAASTRSDSKRPTASTTMWRAPSCDSSRNRRYCKPVSGRTARAADHARAVQDHGEPDEQRRTGPRRAGYRAMTELAGAIPQPGVGPDVSRTAS